MSTTPATTATTDSSAASAERPLRLAVIVGSTRPGRFGPTVARWFTGQIADRAELDIDLVDLAEVPLPAVFGAQATPTDAEQHAALSARLQAADAFVVVTPEYNHSFPGPLKNAIDMTGLQFRAKPVGFVSYGGLGGGLRAVEQLRLVFAEVHAVTMRDSVSFHSYPEVFDADGNAPGAVVAEGAAKGMVDQLCWWGEVLRAARATRPYMR